MLKVASANGASAIELDVVGLAFSSDDEDVTVLRDVTFSVNSGELVVLYGPSGSGKTSLINICAGLTRATSGRVTVAGTEFGPASDEALARLRLTSIGVVFQEHNLVREFSALENIELPLRARGRPRREAEAEATAMLAAVGLSGLEGRVPSRLSGGQRQRVGIARALVGGRSVLLADEPTGALDAENALNVFQLLRGLADTGLAVVVASHDPAVKDFADRLHRVRDGVLEAAAMAARSV